MYVYIYMCIYMCICTNIYVYIYMCTYICVYTSMNIYICVCVCTCIYICVCVCKYIYIYMESKMTLLKDKVTLQKVGGISWKGRNLTNMNSKTKTKNALRVSLARKENISSIIQ